MSAADDLLAMQLRASIELKQLEQQIAGLRELERDAVDLRVDCERRITRLLAQQVLDGKGGR